jgi:AraC-like DNA-binding protein
MSDLKFQGLKFKIHGKTDEQVQEILKPLEVRYAPVRKLQQGKASTYLPIMKYLIYMYDPNTDLNREFVRLEDRKQEAAKLSGLFGIKDLSYIDRIFACTHPESLEVIQILLTEVYHDIAFREWHTLQNELDEYTSARWQRNETSTKKKRRGKKNAEGENEVIEVTTGHDKASMEVLNMKSKLRDECQKIITQIKQYEKEIFGENLDVKEVAYKSRFTNPESFSRAANMRL